MVATLSGLKVVEMATIGPVPFAAMMLADMGATVTRIDRIPRTPQDHAAFAGFDHRGRRSVSLDLKSPPAVAALLRIIEGADVLLEGFRPGVMERLGLGPESCLERNPGLIYGRMTGWGQTGPLAHAAGHDINFIALSGALHAMGIAGQPPSPPLNLVGDYGGGAMMLLVGVVAALYERSRSGKGQVIDAAMTDGVAVLMTAIYSMMSRGVWCDSRQANLLDGGAHFYAVYECADGQFVAIGSIEPQFQQLLMQKCGLDVSELSRARDSATWPALRERLAGIFRTRTRAQWCEIMEGSDVCFAPVLSLSEAPQHPHNLARNAFKVADGMAQPEPAPRFSRTPSRAAPSVPRVGQDTREVLTALGLSKTQISGLITAGGAYACDDRDSSGPAPEVARE